MCTPFAVLKLHLSTFCSLVLSQRWYLTLLGIQYVNQVRRWQVNISDHDDTKFDTTYVSK